MCLYPRIIINRKYTKTKKNKGNIPLINDIRTKYVTIGCNKCIECIKKKSRDWKIRLFEEVRTNNNFSFVTLTFNNESLEIYKNLSQTKDPNEIATIAIRRFLERWRKKTKKSVKHFLITELGHTGTERIHLHGLINSKDKELIKTTWGNGYVYIGDYVNEKTINYITKYITKIDTQHKDFTPKILCSKGIGESYTKRPNSLKNTFNNSETNEMYINRSGLRLPIPIYYRNKIYTEEEREFLWIDKLNKQKRFILGKEIDISKNDDIYFKALEHARNTNISLGYGKIEWKHETYLKKLKLLHLNTNYDI